MTLPSPGKLPVPIALTTTELRLHTTLALDPDEATALRGRLGGESVVHVRRRAAAPDDASPFTSFAARIGVHLGEEGDGDDRDPWLHYEFVLTTWPAREQCDERWDDSFSAVSEVLGTHEATMRAVAQVAPERITVTTIPFDFPALPGFSHVKGLRFAKADEDDDQTDLYSVVVDHQGDHVILDARVAVEVKLDEDFMEGPWALMKGILEMVADLDPKAADEAIL